MKSEPTLLAPSLVDPKTLRRQVRQAKIEADRTAAAAHTAKAQLKLAKKTFKQAKKAAKQARKALKHLKAQQEAAAAKRPAKARPPKMRKLVLRGGKGTPPSPVEVPPAADADSTVAPRPPRLDPGVEPPVPG